MLSATKENATEMSHRFDCRALVFDLDGVLVDSTSYIEEQWRGWAVSKGLAPEPFLKVCHGRRAVETIRLAAPDLDAEAEVAAFVPPAHDNTPLAPIEGAAELLETLPPGSWAVATSGPKAGAVERLRRAGLPIPAVLVGAEDVVQGKPSPDVYLEAARRLGVAPADCVVVEDAPAGIEAGRAAGMRVIALTTTHPIEELSADGYAESLRSIQVQRVGVDRLELSYRLTA
jgi:mannitol-1-/sugar-/sorbitol-6-phosphatase